jgi:hypothetical protein
MKEGEVVLVLGAVLIALCMPVIVVIWWRIRSRGRK